MRVDCMPASPARPPALLTAQSRDRHADADEVTAARAWNLLREQGVYVNLALPPGTPNSLCLLRSSVSAAHTGEQIDQIVARFAKVMADLGTAEPALAG